MARTGRPITLDEDTVYPGFDKSIQLERASSSLDFDANGDITTYTYEFVSYGDGGTERITTITVET